MAATATAHMSGLPTIKCSDCGKDIEIAQIAEHVCSQEPQISTDRFNNAYSSMRTTERMPAPFKSRPAPAGINTSVANRPFLKPAPPTPTGGRNSPFRSIPRSASSPMFHRQRSPSPDLPLAQECAFPAFPISKNTVPRSPAIPKRSKTDEMPSRNTESRSESRTGYTNWSRRTMSKDSISRPSSPASSANRPLTNGSDSNRKSSFSSIRSRPELPSTPEVPPVPHFAEERSESRAGSIAGVRLPFDSPQYENVMSSPPTPDLSEGPPSLPVVPEPLSVRRKTSQGSIHFRKPSVSAAIRPLHEIGSMSMHRPTASRGGSPEKLNAELNFPRSASAQGERSDRRLFDAPPVPGMSAAKFEGFDAPRSQSAMNDRSDFKHLDARPSPLSIPTKAADFNIENNPYHTPSESTSSNDSARNTSSSRSSPLTSTSSFAPFRKQSDAGEERLLESFPDSVPVPAPLHISVPSMPPSSNSPLSAPVSQLNGQYQQQARSPMTPAPASAPPSNNPQPFHQQPRRRPAKSFSRPNAYQPEPEIHRNLPQPPPPPQPQQLNNHQHQPSQSQSQSYYQPQPSPASMHPPESPMDPALQGGRLPRLDTREQYAPREQMVRSPLSAPLYRQSPAIPNVPPSPGFLPTPRHALPQPPRRATTGHKGNCRGCGELIKGKSVSSADGRLTGRWHKHCFTCKTCEEPFQTMDFYVLGNQPYCARHYHELNRSMCNKCDRGIEGHYIETDRRLKFHPHCFTCQDCHLILRDNYFEDPVTSKILCEQHAFRPNLLGPGRRFPEKRSTRLMMMT